MPRVEDVIDGLAGAEYISTLDLTKGYWQVAVSEESRAKTAFTTPFGKYEFLVMPFGLVGAPSTFQRLMNGMFGNLPHFVATYLDDIVVFSPTWNDHLLHLQEVLTHFQKAGITLKPAKCHFANRECEFLGHLVGRGRVRPLLAKTSSIQEFATPKTKKDVRSFLGLGGYYRRFMPQYSTLAAPLTDLTKKELPEKVHWEEEHQQAFQALKDALTSAPVLQGPDYSREFTLQTDASDVGIGGVLCQTTEADGDRPIAYFSRKLKDWEKHYAAVEKEYLAIVEAIRHFCVYLTGTHITVVMDHNCLRFLDNMKDVGGRLTCWSLQLQPYDMAIQHRPGARNANADGLSRQAWDDKEEDPPPLQERGGGSVGDPSSPLPGAGVQTPTTVGGTAPPS